MIGYIGKHWRGGFPLAQSYWLNGVLAALPFFACLDLGRAYLVDHPPVTVAHFALLLVLPFAVLVAVSLWSGVGIWASAGRSIANGKLLWAWLARLAVVANLTLLAIAANSFAREAVALFGPQTAAPATAYEVTLRGNTAVLHGALTDASAGELELLLKDSTVKRLAIAGSTGGSLKPALRLARIVRARKLFVVALAQCDSFCTLLLAAGNGRAIIPETVIAFPHAAGANDAAADWRDALKIYGAAGIAAAALARMPDEPTLRDMIAAGFVTAIFVGQTKHYLEAKTWCVHHQTSCLHTGRQNIAAARAAGTSQVAP